MKFRYAPLPTISERIKAEISAAKSRNEIIAEVELSLKEWRRYNLECGVSSFNIPHIEVTDIEGIPVRISDADSQE